MSATRPSFSLRALFIVMTLVAAVVAFAAQYPGIAFLFLLISPLVGGSQALAYVVKKTANYAERRAPRVTRLIYLLFGVACVVGSLVGWVIARRDSPISGDKWFLLVVFSGGGWVFFYYAWLIPVAPVVEYLNDSSDASRHL